MVGHDIYGAYYRYVQKKQLRMLILQPQTGSTRDRLLFRMISFIFSHVRYVDITRLCEFIKQNESLKHF